LPEVRDVVREIMIALLLLEQLVLLCRIDRLILEGIATFEGDHR